MWRVSVIEYISEGNLACGVSESGRYKGIKEVVEIIPKLIAHLYSSYIKFANK